MNIRIGLGYDIHPLKEDIPLIIGGCKIPSKKGAKGHSDADVLIHAIIDALLGAMGKKDIGTYFPDKDPKYKGISSLILLKKIADLIKDSNFSIVNIDSVVILEIPKIADYIDEMKKNISEVLGISAIQISIKATTNEGMGAVGEKKAIASYAISLLEKL